MGVYWYLFDPDRRRFAELGKADFLHELIARDFLRLPPNVQLISDAEDPPAEPGDWMEQGFEEFDPFDP